jgi:hypothetical protein
MEYAFPKDLDFRKGWFNISKMDEPIFQEFYNEKIH